MYKPQAGYVYEANDAWHIRFYAHEGGKSKQRSAKLCAKDSTHPSKVAPAVVALAEAFIAGINTANGLNAAQPGHSCPLCQQRCRRTIVGKFAPKESNLMGLVVTTPPHQQNF
jgi:hypothetical protein